MAKRNPNGTSKYWYEAASSSLIKADSNTPVGSQKYWYNGQTEGYLFVSTFVPKPRVFAILLGF